MHRAFVLGNGKSRLNANLEKLKSYGTVYGCNALYREYTPNYLIAVDPRMISEICKKKYQIHNEVWTNPNSRFSMFEGLNYFKNPRGWSSGPTALLKSCIDGHTEVYMLGFDYHGINNSFNNVYADTENYKKSSDPATYYGNWLKQTEHVMKEYKNVYFFRAIDTNTTPITEWDKLNNFRHIHYEELKRSLKGI